MAIIICANFSGVSLVVDFIEREQFHLAQQLINRRDDQTFIDEYQRLRHLIILNYPMTEDPKGIVSNSVASVWRWIKKAGPKGCYQVFRASCPNDQYRQYSPNPSVTINAVTSEKKIAKPRQLDYQLIKLAPNCVRPRQGGIQETISN
jgi:hypothetical protein